MRTAGSIMLLLGIVGFLYCNSQMDRHPAPPPGLTVGETLQYPAGRWEAARFASASLGAVGLLLSLFPKGR